MVSGRALRTVSAALFLLASGLAAGGWDGEAAAQLEGSVRAEDGRPLVGATVELWRERTRLATTSTSADGRFRFVGPVVEEARAISAEHMGYRPVRLPVEDGRSEVTFVLEPAPIPLQALRVEATREICTGSDDPGARALWNAARGRYAAGLDTLGVATYVHSSEARVSADQVGMPADSGFEPGQRGSSPLLRAGWERRIARDGYAQPVRRVSSSGSYDSWVYPPLQADLAPHFASETFGRLHDFQLVSQGPDGWTLAFCPREADRPAIEGTVTLTPDTAFASAAWLFRTPEPTEGAGGEARFRAPAADEARPLLPERSLFWRRVPDGEYLRKYERYEEWRLAQGDSVPFLPVRPSRGERPVPDHR